MASLRLIAIALISVLTLSLVGCSSDSNNGGGAGNKKLSPSERWPETGDFRYNFSENMNGSTCRASDFFYRKADYCMALTNRDKNNECALGARRGAYSANCGNDFEETNIKGQDWFGYDSRQKSSCSTPHVFDNFPTLSDYCNFLKDETKHEYCHWDNRQHEFRRNRCAGAFSPEPNSGNPAPAPTPEDKIPAPAPTATPVPSPTPDARPQVARDLEAAGIKVTIDYNSQIPVRPGDPSFQQQLVKFWSVLENVKGALISRRQFITEVSLTQYTVYHPQRQYVSLDVVLTEGEVLGYLSLLDRRLALQMKLGLAIDLGIEIYGFERGDKLADLRTMTETLENSVPDLLRIRSTVKELKLRDYFHYSFYSRELQLKKDDLRADLAKAVRLLQPMNEFFEFADTNGFDIKAPISNADLEIDGPAFGALTKKLMVSKGSLLELKALGQLKEISISSIRDETLYYDGLKNLSPASVGTAFDALPETLTALTVCFRLAQDMKVEFKPLSGALTKNLIKSANRFDKYFTKIKAKTSLRTIYYGDSSSVGYASLTIGANDSDAAFEKVLAGIK